MKIRTFRVTNFKTLKDITFEFHRSKGLWHISGVGTGNGVGKTNFLDALRIHFTNISNNNYKKYLRHGETTFTTELTDWDGNVTKLSRGAIDFYEWNINGDYQFVEKTGGKVPSELVDYFNLYIEREKTNQIVNFRNNDMVRLFTKTTEGDNFLLLQKALGTEDFMVANRKTKKDKRALTDKINAVDLQIKDEDDYNTNLSKKIEDKKESITTILTSKKNLDKLMDKYNLINDLINLVTKIQEVDKFISESSSGLSDVNIKEIEKDIYKHKEIDKTIIREKRYIETSDEYTYLKGKVEELDSIVGDIPIKLNILKELSFVKDLLERENRIGNYLDKINTDNVREKLDLSEELLNKQIKIVDVINDVKKYSKSNKEYTNYKDKSVFIKENIDSIRESFDICPFCQQEIKGNHIH